MNLNIPEFDADKEGEYRHLVKKNTFLWFGKHLDYRAEWVALNDPEYLLWAEREGIIRMSKELSRLAKEVADQKTMEKAYPPEWFGDSPDGDFLDPFDEDDDGIWF